MVSLQIDKTANSQQNKTVCRIKLAEHRLGVTTNWLLTKEKKTTLIKLISTTKYVFDVHFYLFTLYSCCRQRPLWGVFLQLWRFLKVESNRITLYLRSPDYFSLSGGGGGVMQPPAVSKGSRCTCLSVFYQRCSLDDGEQQDDPRAT